MSCFSAPINFYSAASVEATMSSKDRGCNKIPPELLGSIFDHCLAELQSCSVVCKRWLGPSRYRLFSTIKLTHSNTPTFMQFLASESGPLIGPCVRCLTIQTGDSLPWFIEALPALSTYLRPLSLQLMINKHVNQVWLTNGKVFTVNPPPGQDLAIFASSFRTIIDLKLSITCDTFLEIAELVASFPVLETLSLSASWASDEVEFPPHDVYLSKYIHTMELFFRSAPFLRWMHDHEPLPRLSKLSLASGAFDQPEIAGACVRALGSSLQHLSMMSLFQKVPSDHIDLACHPDLRTIKIRTWVDPNSVAFRLLSQITSHHVEEIDFTAWDPSDSLDITADHWFELDALLTSAQFPLLRSIIIDADPQYESNIREHLQACQSRQILYFRRKAP